MEGAIVEDEKTMKTLLAHKLDFLTNMDAVSRKLCPQMEFFVAFSSIEFEYTSSSESLYCFANGKIQNLIRNRKDLNLPAVSQGFTNHTSNGYFYNNTQLNY